MCVCVRVCVCVHAYVCVCTQISRSHRNTIVQTYVPATLTLCVTDLLDTSLLTMKPISTAPTSLIITSNCSCPPALSGTYLSFRTDPLYQAVMLNGPMYAGESASPVVLTVRLATVLRLARMVGFTYTDTSTILSVGRQVYRRGRRMCLGRGRGEGREGFTRHLKAKFIS